MSDDNKPPQSPNHIHIVQRPGGDWAAKKPGAQRASHTATTQRGAFEKARRQAKREKSEVVIHGTNGKIRRKHSYGNDPHPPKG